MKIQTKELTGTALDWAVAIAAKMSVEIRPAGKCGRPLYVLAAEQDCTPWIWYPSESWHHGGPIIEREHIALDYYHTPVHPDVQPRWEARHGSGVFEYGPTKLIAAMRCYVTSELGDEVDVPKELT